MLLREAKRILNRNGYILVEQNQGEDYSYNGDDEDELDRFIVEVAEYMMKDPDFSKSFSKYKARDIIEMHRDEAREYMESGDEYRVRRCAKKMMGYATRDDSMDDDYEEEEGEDYSYNGGDDEFVSVAEE